jgi:hypothetical protein
MQEKFVQCSLKKYEVGTPKKQQQQKHKSFLHVIWYGVKKGV